MKGCRPLSREEVQATLAAFHGRYAVRNRCLFLLGVTTGFRISELLSLRLRDVFMGGDIRKDIRVTRSKMKGKREGRIIDLADSARYVISKQVKALQQQGWWNLDTYLFRAPGLINRAISRNRAWQILQDVFTRLGIGGCVGCHTMRKTFANGMYDFMLLTSTAGTPSDALFETSKALGHVSPTNTTAYLSFRQERVKAGVAYLGRLYGDCVLHT